MIVMISKDDFLKNYKKLTKSGEYGLINGTDNDDIKEFGAVKNSEEDFHHLKAPATLTDKNKVDSARREAKLKGYLKAPAMTRTAAMAAALQIADGETIKPDKRLNKNIYIILPNKTYDKLAKDIRKRWLKIYGITDSDGDVVVLFTNLGDALTGDDREKLVKKELSRIDARIDKLTSQLESGLRSDLWSDSDIERTERRVEKLRKQRKKLKSGKLEGAGNDAIRCKILGNGEITRTARKKLSKFVINYHEHNGSDAYLSRHY